MNIENGTRLSTALTYLTDEVWRRDNLTIRGETLVDTVRFEQRRATGVRLVGGEEIDADTVILAAGTLGSAALLLRSGVGPAADLDGLGIPVVADLPVGQHYMDQPASLVLHATTPGKLGGTEPPVSVILVARSGGRQDGPPDLHVAPHPHNGRRRTLREGQRHFDKRGGASPRGRLAWPVDAGLARPRAYLRRSNSGSCATRRISRSSPTASNWRAGSRQPSPSRTISTRRSRRDPRSGAERRSSHSCASTFRPTWSHDLIRAHGSGRRSACGGR